MLPGMFTVVRGVVLVTLAAALVALVLPQLAGGGTLTVRSGSMEPAYPVGSLVIVWPVSAHDVEVGDVITFVDPERDGYVTHRVVEVAAHADGSPTFVTRGDANDADDARPVHADRVLGRVVVAVPLVGALAATLRTAPGWIALVVVPSLAYVLAEVAAIVRAVRRDRGGVRSARDPVGASASPAPAAARRRRTTASEGRR